MGPRERRIAGTRYAMPAGGAGAGSAQGAPPFEVARGNDWLRVDLPGPHRTASWALAGGGLGCTRTVVWFQVRSDDLRPPTDAHRYLAARLAGLGYPGAPGSLTSRRLDAFVVAERTFRDVTAACVATVGLGNALRAGDLPGASGRIGTINVLCRVNVALGDGGLLEALAAEARTVAVLECGVASARSGAPALGTGTDCIAIATPAAGPASAYASKHTAVGHVVGAAVEEAVRRGATARAAERSGA
jgi:adenosylcobinamide amidohydrolase